MGEDDLAIKSSQPSSIAGASAAVSSDTSESKPRMESVAGAEMKKRTEIVKRQREIIHAREEDTKLTARLGDLVLPFIVLGILALIISFVLIPFSTEIVENRKQSALLVEEIRAKQEKVKTLNNISLEKLEKNLRIVSKVVKDEKNVSELMNEIDELAIANNLTPESEQGANISAMVAHVEEDLNWKPQSSDSITGPISAYGKFEDICNFINALRLRSSTILSLGEVSVARKMTIGDGTDAQPVEGEGDSDMWEISLVMKGYVVKPEVKVAIEDPVVTKIDENLLKEITERAAWGNDAINDSNGEDDTDGGINGTVGD